VREFVARGEAIALIVAARARVPIVVFDGEAALDEPHVCSSSIRLRSSRRPRLAAYPS
jgi:hypothetical protein